MASKTYRSCRYIVRMITRASGCSARIALVAATPSISGICISMRMTSGLVSRACRMASRPVEASPMTLNPSSVSRIPRRPCLNMAWSSHRRIRVMHPLYPYAPAHGGTLLGAAAGHVALGHAPEPPHQAGGLVARGVPGSCLAGGAMVTRAHSEPKPVRAEIGGRMSHPRGVLMERAQKLGLAKPELRTEQTGPEHEPRFLSDVVIDGEVLGTGQGGTKRTAEKYAAEEALTALESRSGGKAG